MIRKQVTIASYKSMADGSLRICNDLLATSPEDVKAIAELYGQGEVTMILCGTENLVETITQISKELLDGTTDS